MRAISDSPIYLYANLDKKNSVTTHFFYYLSSVFKSVNHKLFLNKEKDIRVRSKANIWVSITILIKTDFRLYIHKKNINLDCFIWWLLVNLWGQVKSGQKIIRILYTFTIYLNLFYLMDSYKTASQVDKIFGL